MNYEYLKPFIEGGPLSFEQLTEKLDAADGVKLANLKDGGYVGKDKFDALEARANGLQAQLSEAIGKQNYNKVITPEEYWDKLPMIQYHMDAPLADPAAIALYFVCNLASQSLKGVLSGEGADEIFGGYNVYSEPGGSAYDKLPR